MRRLSKEEIKAGIFILSGFMLVLLALFLVYGVLVSSGQISSIGFLLVLGLGMMYYGRQQWKKYKQEIE